MNSKDALQWANETKMKRLDISNPPRGGSGIPVKSDKLNVTVKIEADDILKRIFDLPEYGEVRIITHAGKITFIETTTKEKVE